MQVQSADCMVVVGNQVALVRRRKEPFKSKLVLPGGKREIGESLAEAAVRELAEEIGLGVSVQELKMLLVLDTPGRDHRPDRKSSAVFLLYLSALPELAPAEFEIVWREVQNLAAEEMGFDHYVAITHFRQQL